MKRPTTIPADGAHQWANSHGVLTAIADNVLCSRLADAARAAASGESMWRTQDGERTYGVTHWIPLPAPPSHDPLHTAGAAGLVGDPDVLAAPPSGEKGEATS